jgi:hypothetical protein
MSSFVANAQNILVSAQAEPPFQPTPYSLFTSDGKGGNTQVEWTVEVCPDGRMITRQVSYNCEL